LLLPIVKTSLCGKVQNNKKIIAVSNDMKKTERDEKLEKKRKCIMKDVNDGSIRTIQNKVALLLKKHHDTRESDITLQLKYWEKYCEDLYKGNYINPSDLYNLPKLTSIVRARAFIQNTLGLYGAKENLSELRRDNEEKHHNYYKKSKRSTKRNRYN
jgi:hypothetical protein